MCCMASSKTGLHQTPVFDTGKLNIYSCASLQRYGTFQRCSHFPLYRHSNLRPFVLGSYGRGQLLGCHWGPFKGLDKMEDGVSRMSRSSVRPCYITESRCWAQKEAMLQRIFSVTDTSRRLSPTLPPMPPHPSQACTSSPFCCRHGLCGPPCTRRNK